MIVESNKLILRSFYEEVWAKGNLSFADKVFASDYVRHELRPGNPPPGPEGQKQIAKDFRTAFPDLKVTIDLIFGEGDMAVARWTMSGTHTGRWGKVPPTGKHAKFSGVNIARFANGKIVEMWNHRDDLGVMQELGVPVYAGGTRA